MSSWRDEATCNSGRFDPDMWFPVQHDMASALEARRVCREECPVREQCAEYAVNFPTTLTGVWGGLSQREIRSERLARGLSVESEAQFSGLPNYVRHNAIC